MKEYHKSIEPIFCAMKDNIQSEIEFVEKFNNWSLEVLTNWNKKVIRVKIKSRKNNLNHEFVPCKLSQYHLFTLLSYVTRARSESYSFTGKKSKYSDLILSSDSSNSLMKAKNATIELKGNYLIFTGEIKKSDKHSLSNIFKLVEMLIQEIDMLK